MDEIKLSIKGLYCREDAVLLITGKAGGDLKMDFNKLAEIILYFDKPEIIIFGNDDPFDQAKPLTFLVAKLTCCEKEIMVQTRYRYQELKNTINLNYLWIREVLERIDALICGHEIIIPSKDLETIELKTRHEPQNETIYV